MAATSATDPTRTPPAQRLRTTLAGRLLDRLRPGRRTPDPLRASHACDMGLGIGELPDGIGRVPSGLPCALIAADADCEARWFPPLIRDAVAARVPLFVIAQQEAWADALVQDPEVRAALASGQLMIHIATPGLVAAVRSHGWEPLRRSMVLAGLRDESAVVMLGAESLVTGMPLESLARTGAQLRQWCRNRARPVVLAFSPAAAQAGVRHVLRNWCSGALHLATLGPDGDRWGLYLDRWDSDDGMIAETFLGISRSASDNRLAYDGVRAQGAQQRLLDAPDQHQVLATVAAVEGQPGVPRRWILAESLDELEHMAALSLAATVVIDAGEPADLERRARLVHTLRTSRPRTLKIVIRETTNKLRSNSEKALLQLGANAVIYREVGFSRLLTWLDDMNHETFAREVPPDYEAALASFMPAPQRGYQTGPRFVALVQDTLAQTAGVGLPHSLVRLELIPRVPHLDALRACCASRDGDLVTTHDGGLVVFLFACPEPDVEATLERLFSVPLGQLFDTQTAVSDAEGIRLMLEPLASAPAAGASDFSLFLGSPSPAPTSPGSHTSSRRASSVSAPRQEPPVPGQSGPHPVPLTKPADRAGGPSVHAKAIHRRSAGAPDRSPAP